MLLAVAIDTRADCPPLAKYCCGQWGIVMCQITPTTPGLVCLCGEKDPQGKAC